MGSFTAGVTLTECLKQPKVTVEQHLRIEASLEGLPQSYGGYCPSISITKKPGKECRISFKGGRARNRTINLSPDGVKLLILALERLPESETGIIKTR